MTKYIALLRGVNVGGKNQIPMADLKKGFEEWNCRDVMTCLNSGNVVFSTEIQDPSRVMASVMAMIKSRFGLDIPVAIIEPAELGEILRQAPKWWGNDRKDIYDNIIFIIPPATFEEIYGEIGEPKPEMERISNYKNAIFWSFVRKDYAKTSWIKTAGSSINDKVTIRTANTMRKLLALAAR